VIVSKPEVQSEEKKRGGLGTLEGPGGVGNLTEPQGSCSSQESSTEKKETVQTGRFFHSLRRGRIEKIDENLWRAGDVGS